MNLDNNTDERTGILDWPGGFTLVFVVSFVCIALLFYAILLTFIWTSLFPVVRKMKEIK